MRRLLHCVSIVLMMLTAFLVFKGMRAKDRARAVLLPPATPIAAWLPEEAEVYPAAVVHPGTFSVSLKLEEFQRRFPTGGLVAFHYDPEPEEEVV